MTGCIEWAGGRHTHGYGVKSAHVDGKAVTLYAHRLAWEEANGPIPSGMWVLHHCDNPPCVNPEHLFLGTQTDNMRDMAAKGRHGAQKNPGAYARRLARFVRRGADHRCAKFTGKQVASIRAKYAAGGCTHREIAAEYGVQPSTITRILQGKTYRTEAP